MHKSFKKPIKFSIPLKTVEELRRVLASLQIEKLEEQTQYQRQLKDVPIPEQVKNGTCWFPLVVQKTGWSLGDHPFIVIERTKGIGNNHKFRAGQVARFFSMQQNVEDAVVRGVINYVEKNVMKITLYGNSLPEWLNKGKIGVQQDFDERSYQEMETALRTVIDTKNERLLHLREVILGAKKPLFDREHRPIHIPYMNPAQNEAINKIISAEDIGIVHGPPGTGKTTTFVQAIKQVAKHEGNILVCAPSNAAADLLAERLADEKLIVVRIGNLSRIDESIVSLTIEGRMANRPEMQTIKQLKIDADAARRAAEKYRRNFGEEEREERRQARIDATQFAQQAEMLEAYVIDRIISEADVIVGTLVGSMNRYIEKRKFHTVFIDEASQALEPSTWIPIIKSQRVIFAGDPFQLPPTVKSAQAAKDGLDVTLMEKTMKRQPEASVLLNIQYRMHETIMNFSNKEFYSGNLVAADFVKYRLINASDGRDKPLEFIDTAGCGYEEKINKESQSRYNPDEYSIIRKHLTDLITACVGDPPTVAIISPYKEQVIFIQDEFKANEIANFKNVDIEIDTIDSFQGQERDVIYISLVRSNDTREIGFLKDYRRMNVAMTRAKKKLVIIGDSATLGGYKFYENFLNYCEANDAYFTAWEWAYD